MGLAAWVGVIVVALAFGVVAQFVGQASADLEWLPVAAAFVVGAVAASEFVVGWRAIEPVMDQLAVIPALGGGLIVGLLVQVVIRLLTGGTYRGSGRALYS
jgi:hypothetical protein